MYSREYFVERFRRTVTEELVGRLAAGELTEEAQAAIIDVLGERGIDREATSALMKDAKKASFRRTRPGNGCDFCGASVFFGAVKDGEQKFCGEGCLRKARLMEVAVDIPDYEVYRHALVLRHGPCPICLRQESEVEARKSYWIWSLVYYTRSWTSTKICCKKCGVGENLTSIAACVVAGWWGIPFGLILTPFQIIENIMAMFHKVDLSRFSDELLQEAKLQLAEAIMTSGEQRPEVRAVPLPTDR